MAKPPTTEKENGSWNFSGKSDSQFGYEYQRFTCPEAARRDVARWYYMISPPSNYQLQNGAEFDWSSEYDETEPEIDLRHRTFYK